MITHVLVYDVPASIAPGRPLNPCPPGSLRSEIVLEDEPIAGMDYSEHKSPDGETWVTYGGTPEEVVDPPGRRARQRFTDSRPEVLQGPELRIVVEENDFYFVFNSSIDLPPEVESRELPREPAGTPIPVGGP